jgi:hypothetical protein
VIRMRNAILVLAAAMLVGCSPEDPCMGSDATLGALLARHVVLVGSEIVDLSALAAFPWDRMFIFAPYTDRSEVEKTTGLEYRTGWRGHVPEGRDLVAFVREEGGGCYYEFATVGSAKAKWTFTSDAYDRRGIPRELARFAVKRSDELPVLEWVASPTAK